MRVFEENYRLHSGGDVSSTSRNLEITPKPRILLKSKVFGFLALFCASIFALYALGYAISFDFSNFILYKGFLTLKARLASFSRWAQVSEIPLSELSTLSARREKRLIERTDDAQMHGRFSSRFSQLTKWAECLS